MLTECCQSCAGWWSVGREPDEPLFLTASGHRLHASAFKRTLAWSATGEGRRIHDLRHTAACLWLARGVDPVTVQAWMGHASIATRTGTCTTSGARPTVLDWIV